MNESKNNTALVAIIAILGTILIFFILFFVLFFSGVLHFNINEKEVTEEVSVVQKGIEENTTPQTETKQANAPVVNEVKETIWTYNEYEAEQFIENALYAFVNGINTRSANYIYTYFAGDELQQELASHNEIIKVVDHEELLSVNCHTVERISNSQITVMRDSVIRVYYKDGRIVDIPETYRYTIDLSSGEMKIVEIERM